MLEFRNDQWTLSPELAGHGALARVPAFLPDWELPDRGPGQALVSITDHFVNMLARRAATAPVKAQLALLELVGVKPIASQPARCPVVFELPPGNGHSQVPVRSQLSAQPTEAGDPLIFETFSTIGLANSRLVEVKTILPSDAASQAGGTWSDHTDDVLGEKPFMLFDRQQTISRELYLAHDHSLAVTPGSTIELHVEVVQEQAHVPSRDMETRWEYWDGDGWMAFAPPRKVDAATDGCSEDGTHHLTRSGLIRLRSGGKPAQKTTVRGLEAYWIRCRLIKQGSANFPQIDRIRVALQSEVKGFQCLDSLKETLPKGEIAKLCMLLTDPTGVPLGSFKDYTIQHRVDMAVSTWSKQQSETDTVEIATLHQSEEKHLVEVSWTGAANTTRSSLVVLKTMSPQRDHLAKLARAGLLPEMAFAAGLNADVTAPFQPFGPQPQLGTIFLFTCPELFSKPGARATVWVEATRNIPQSVTPFIPPAAAIPAAPAETKPASSNAMTRWEYWNGEVWSLLPDFKGDAKVQTFMKSGEVNFTIPENMALKKEFGQEKPWIRVIVVGGSYIIPNAGQVTVDNKPVQFAVTCPPTIHRFRLEYEYASPAVAPKACLSHSNFHWQDHTRAAAFGGSPFLPFRRTDEVRPVTYLGFSRSLPADLISLYLNVQRSRPMHDLAWEYHDGKSWRRLVLERDDTQGLSLAGLVQFTWPGTPGLIEPVSVSSAEGRQITFLDARQSSRYRPGDIVAIFENDIAEAGEVEVASQGILTLTAPLLNKYTANAVAGPSPLARFGAPRHWVRILWPSNQVPRKDDPDAIKITGIYLNAVFAEHAKTVRNQILGNTTGMSGETFDILDRPIFENEEVEILELEGPLAEAGHAALKDDVWAQQGKRGVIKEDLDPVTGKRVRVWVRWQERSSFAGAGPLDRVYVLDRTHGILQFGDGERGLIPPVLPNNLRITYRTGGGRKGNVAPRTIVTVLNGATAATVFNPVRAEGGADGEVLQHTGDQQYRSLLERGPQVIRHRHRAVTANDFEQLALASSPGVAAARVLTAVSTRGMVRAGAVQVVILPHAEVNDQEPMPSPTLKDQVRQYLRACAPYAVAQRIQVVDPQFASVGVELVLTPKMTSQAGILSRAAPLVIRKFLHPVLGGLQGRGWPFGATLFCSDLVRFLHQDGDGTLKGSLGLVKSIHFLEHGTPVEEMLTIAPNCVPTAGPIRLVIDSAMEVCS